MRRKHRSIVLTLLIGLTFVGCANTKVEPVGDPASWLTSCVVELARSDDNQVRWFNNIGANDVVLIPETNVVEEMFQKCESVEPLSKSEIPYYRMWLEDRVSEILDITAGTTRRRVSQILLLNGGICTPKAGIYSHKQCRVLKVRIEFKPARTAFDENDQVTDISTPYLGLFLID